MEEWMIHGHGLIFSGVYLIKTGNMKKSKREKSWYYNRFVFRLWLRDELFPDGNKLRNNGWIYIITMTKDTSWH
jgi:hypothetical protein